MTNHGIPTALIFQALDGDIKITPQIDIPSWQASEQPCERCNTVIQPDKIVWLELRTSDSSWHVPGAVMEWTDPDSQGVFSFGATCAEIMLKESK